MYTASRRHMAAMQSKV